MTNRDIVREYLSIEYHYPDCPACGMDGGLGTVRESVGHGSGWEWRCLRCDRVFSTPPGSDWSGIEHLSQRQRNVYCHRVIRGVPVKRVARVVGVRADAVSAVVRDAKDRMQAAD